MQFVKEDPLTEKILQRLGFFERDQTKDGDILALCENYKNSLDEASLFLGIRNKKIPINKVKLPFYKK